MNVFKLPDPKLQWNQKNPNRWVVTEDFYIELLGFNITVEKGYVTDLASIPMLAITIANILLFIINSLLFLCKIFSLNKFKYKFDYISKNGVWTASAIVHDYLYSEHTKLHPELSKHQSDLIFLILMLAYKTNPSTAVIMYWSVVLFGQNYWSKND